MSKDMSPDLHHLSEAELMAQLDVDLLPKHVAVIMDGNGRWAEIRGLPRIAGHREGINSVRELLTPLWRPWNRGFDHLCLLP